MRLEELHASKGESGCSGTVEWGGDTALKGMTERGGSGVKKFFAFFFEDLGEGFGVVDV